MKRKSTPIEDLMDKQLQEAGLTGYLRDAQFIPDRRFRGDFVWPDLKLVLEVDGGIYLAKSGHTSPKGYESDRIRDIEGLRFGYLTVRVTTSMVKSGYAIERFSEIYRMRKEGKLSAPL